MSRPSRASERPNGRARARAGGSADPRPLRVELALSITKEGVGLTLARPVELGCVRLVDVLAVLPALRFPVDVSGGVARFRNRRGRLDRAVVELDWAEVARFAGPRVAGLLGPGRPEVHLRARPGGAEVVLVARAERRTLAFDVLADVNGPDLVLFVWRARGSGLPRPAAALATSAVRAVVGPLGEVRGRSVRLGRLVGSLARATFPDGGARVPDASGVGFARVATSSDGAVIVLERSPREVAAEPLPELTRAREATELLLAADDALSHGETPRARELLLGALGRAHRHPDALLTLAELDAVEGREHAALAALAELSAAESRPAAGALEAELLSRVEPRRAVEAWLRAAELEPSGELAAEAFARAASATSSADDALEWLGEALARAPTRPDLALARVDAAIRAGRLDAARADVQRLEALAPTAREKHALLRRAADAYLAAGAPGEAAKLYERAVLFAPDDPLAIGGLGRSFVALGRHGRGAQLLQRAVDRAPEAHDLVLELARVVADRLEDLPAAIARAHSVPSEAPEGIEARRLEARWRARLGDVAGASLGYARMRARVEDAGRRDLVPWLAEAASFEETTRGDLAAAQRHLVAALGLAPDNEALRESLARLSAAPRRAQPLEDDGGRDDGPTQVKLPEPRGEDAPTQTRELTDDEAELRAEELTRRLQADPTSGPVADELATLLARLGRSMELLALLSARLEEASPEERARLIPGQRAVLARLADEAEGQGKRDEAALFRDALDAITD